MAVNGQVDDTQSAPGSWLPIGEAARRLSVSERTIFRRTERGHLLRRLSAHGQVEVWVPADPTDKTSDAVSADDGQERALILAERLTQALSRQVEPLMAELAESRRTIVDLARENGDLHARVAELERELTTARQVSDADRQGWWSRFRSWMSGP